MNARVLALPIVFVAAVGGEAAADSLEMNASGADNAAWAAYACPGCAASTSSAPTSSLVAPQRTPPYLEVSGSFQSLRDTDVSVNGQVRAGLGIAGVQFAISSFHEQAPKGTDADDASLQLWDLSAVFQITAGVPTRADVFLTTGLAGLSSEDRSLLGIWAGVDARVPWGDIDLLASVGGRLLEDDVNALSTRLALGVSVFEIGYRLTAFENGPTLRGPEVGVAWRY